MNAQAQEVVVIEIRRSVLVKYSPAQMFELVNELEAYTKRFAWCADSDVVVRCDNGVVAKLDLKFAGFSQSFTTRNVLDPPRRMEMNLVEGPFRTLHGVWDFTALG